ncbi:MAG TPA: hypothetical protein VI733_04920 [Candidatus Limnocylindria bacterium]|nr:hypothetical protein [Candidatus Limnocylindria bacterium]
MFGRRNREGRQEAERERSRRALFEELAKRPEGICPFLGLASSQIEYHTAVTREHRCYAFGEPSELSAEQQERVCLGRGYVNCPRYLRGVLVIPTEELEALRRPLPPVKPPARPPVPPAPQAPKPGGRRLPVVIGLVLLLAVGVTAGAIAVLNGNGTAVNPSATPSPSAEASLPPSGSQQPSPSNQTPFPETPRPDPTPQPGDTFIGYEVTVLEGQNILFEVDEQGNKVDQTLATFSRFSKAPVDKVEAPNGILHWRTSLGFYTGLSYIHGDSGAFLIREVYEGSDGTKRYAILPDEEI